MLSPLNLVSEIPSLPDRKSNCLDRGLVLVIKTVAFVGYLTLLSTMKMMMMLKREEKRLILMMMMMIIIIIIIVIIPTELFLTINRTS